MPLQAGVRLGPYEILASLGVGGMGEVYRARDTRLGREVAVKVFRESVSADPHRRRRFEQEARAVAALNHPHICQIYDVGPDYLVFELVDGTELGGPRTTSEVVRLALQIADALAAAHASGIVHRDLKPSNVVVTSNGAAKLLDFGIAKLDAPGKDLTLTAEGAVIGTVAYMAPEQAAGKPVDARSDIFSFGALLYELASGRRAFEGDTVAEVIGAVLQREPRSLGGPPALERIVRKCLAKDPARRYQTMAEVRASLAPLAAEPAESGIAPSIAVLPFANMSGDRDNEYFSDGLAEEVINALTRIPGLKVIARTSAFAFKGKHEDIRRIADALGVTTILEGSVRRAGNRVRVTAQLINAADGSHVWSERYDRELADVFEIQDYVAASIANALKITLIGSAGRHRYTPKLPAFEALLKGRQFMLRDTPEQLFQAKVHFEQAIALDPRYAEAHASLGVTYLCMSMLGVQPLRETAPLIRAEANKALSIDPRDPAPEFLLGSVTAAHDYDWSAAREAFEIAMAGTVPAEAHWAYASLYLQPLGLFEEAAFHMERAVERDPLSVLWRAIFGSHLIHAGRVEDAIAQANEAIKLDTTHFAPYTILGEAYVTMGRWPEAVVPLEEAHRRFAGLTMSSGMLAGALARAGNRARADEVLRELPDEARAHMGRALFHTIVGDTQKALEWLERAVEYRDPFALVFIGTELFRSLRETPDWPRIARLMRLPALPDIRQ